MAALWIKGSFGSLVLWSCSERSLLSVSTDAPLSGYRSASLFFFLLFLLWIIFIWWFSTPTRCIEMGKLHSKHGKMSYSREKNHSCSCWVLRYFRVTHSLSLVFLFLFLSPSQKLLFVNRGRVQKVSALIPLHDALKHFLSISVSLWTAEQFPESVSASA